MSRPDSSMPAHGFPGAVPQERPGQPVPARNVSPAPPQVPGCTPNSSLTPGYVPPAPPQVPAMLAAVVIALAAAVTVIQIVAWITSFGVVSEIQEILRSGTGPLSAVHLYDSITVVNLVVQLIAGVVTWVWLWRSRAFAEAVNPGADHARSRVWVWLGWCLPVVSLWFPYQVVRDVSTATRRRPPSGSGMWWTGWLVGGLGANLAGRVTTVDTIEMLPGVHFVGTVGIVLALVGWIRIIRDLTRAQQGYGAASLPAGQ